MRRYQRAALLCAASFGALMTPAGAGAQAAGENSAGTKTAVDDNRIDLITGQVGFTETVVDIGTAANGLALTRTWNGSWQYNFNGALSEEDTDPDAPNYRDIRITIGGDTIVFAADSGDQQSDGAFLTRDQAGYTYTTADGTAYRFESGPLANAGYTGATAMLTTITLPSGERQSIVYQSGSYSYCGYYDYWTGECAATYTAGGVRPTAITSSRGFQIRMSYRTNAFNASTARDWYRVSKATALNTAIDYCDIASDNCSYSRIWPTVSIGYDAAPGGGLYETVTDTLNRSTRYTTNSSDQMVGIKSPAAAADDRSFSYNGDNVTVGRPDGTWTYNSSINRTFRTTTITDPQLRQTTVVINRSKSAVSSSTDANNQTTSYLYDNNGRLLTVYLPDGQETDNSYDARGNLTRVVHKPRAGSPLANIVTSSVFPASCSAATAKICNKPISTTDARGGVTDFSYDGTHGSVLAITKPAPIAGGARPQTLFYYEPRYGYSQNGSGGLQASDQPIYVLTANAACPTTTSCVGSADEVRTTFGYGTPGTAEGLYTKTVSTGSGNGALVATSGYTFDAVGNVTSIDGPLPGAQDLIRNNYDTERQLKATMAPDPDGAGPRGAAAMGYDYDANGQRTIEVSGSVPSGATDWSGFAANNTVRTTYDSSGRKASEQLEAGGTVRSRAQYSYTTGGRLLCEAVRMDPAQWDGQSDACTPQVNGPNGPDRISSFSYDNVGHVTAVAQGYGTPGGVTESTGYASNGDRAWVRDANGNQTDYGYDGFGRLSTTTLPGGSYEQLGYDANGNVTSRRLRDGQVIGYDYDALNRRTYDHNPQTGIADRDVAYSYDLVGSLTETHDGNGWSAAFEYDALGRVVKQSSNLTSNSFQYDGAGRRTRQAWADGFFVTYEYDAAGAMAAIRENGAGLLASFGYDDLGRRTSLTRGNNVVTRYGYTTGTGADARETPYLTSLGLDLAGTGQDQVYGFGYNAAGQITRRSASNAAYAWNGAVNLDRGYQVNGLNQYSQSGGVTPSYDGRGNLTQAGGPVYQYNQLNQLYSKGAGTLYYRNPTGVLGQIIDGSSTTALDYVGDLLATEIVGGNVARRYVYGPGTDEPLVWYEGAGTGDKRYLVADERGSIVAVTDGSGQATSVNSYDEYGIPGYGNQGRFQYTGQKWIAELGMYDYKARMYSPSLGRFMQTDPIGYGDGLNWYAYVGNDPINGTDSSGLKQPEDGKAAPQCGDEYCGPPINVCAHGTYVASYDACVTYKVVFFGPGGDYRRTQVSVSPPYRWPRPAAPQKENSKNCPVKPTPPAARTYAIPKGYMASTDKQNRFVTQSGKQGLQVNPLYSQAMRQAGGTNWKGVAIDLLKIAGSVSFALRAGEIGGSLFYWDVPDVLRAAGLVGSSAGKTVVDLSNGEECEHTQ